MVNVNLNKILELTIAARVDHTKSQELENLVKNAIYEQEASKNGNVSTYKLVKKYLDKIKKTEPHRTGIHGIFINEDQQMIFTNSYSAFVLNKKIEGLPESEGFPNVSRIFEGTRKNDIKVELPSIKELKAQTKIAKSLAKEAGVKKIVAIDEGRVRLHNNSVDVELLTEAMEILGSNVECYSKDDMMTPIHLKSEMGEAIVLPLRN